ncbi:MAG: hypothetical protein ABSB74_09170 [Tepidisphaeraceae bacterium]
MSDRMEQFESELSRLRPRAAGPEWTGKIAAELAAERRSDRTLIAAMSAGALAACVIASLLIDQSSTSMPPSSTVVVTHEVPQHGSNVQAFAGADLDAWN